MICFISEITTLPPPQYLFLKDKVKHSPSSRNFFFIFIIYQSKIDKKMRENSKIVTLIFRGLQHLNEENKDPTTLRKSHSYKLKNIV